MYGLYSWVIFPQNLDSNDGKSDKERQPSQKVVYFVFLLSVNCTVASLKQTALKTIKQCGLYSLSTVRNRGNVMVKLVYCKNLNMACLLWQHEVMADKYKTLPNGVTPILHWTSGNACNLQTDMHIQYKYSKSTRCTWVYTQEQKLCAWMIHLLSSPLCKDCDVLQSTLGLNSCKHKTWII